MLLPFLLASPMIMLGPYGLPLAEILIVIGGALLLFTHYQLSVPIPRFLIAWLNLRYLPEEKRRSDPLPSTVCPAHS